MAIIKSNDCGGLSVSGGGNTTVNVAQTNCGCGCGGSGGGGSSGGSGGGVLPPELGGPPVGTGSGGGGTGGGTGGGPGGSIGSGDGGDPNSDGGDTQIVPAKCIPLGSPPNEPFGHDGFELAAADITSQILDAVATIPGYDSEAETVSVKMQIDGLCWTGFSIAGGPLSPNRKLSVTDAALNKRLVAYTEERGGISVQGVGVSSLSYRYADSFSVDMRGGNPVIFDGQMPRSSLGSGAVGDPDKDAPAWLTAAVCSAIQHKASDNFAFKFDLPASGTLYHDETPHNADWDLTGWQHSDINGNPNGAVFSQFGDSGTHAYTIRPLHNLSKNYTNLTLRMDYQSRGGGTTSHWSVNHAVSGALLGTSVPVSYRANDSSHLWDNQSVTIPGTYPKGTPIVIIFYIDTGSGIGDGHPVGIDNLSGLWS